MLQRPLETKVIYYGYPYPSTLSADLPTGAGFTITAYVPSSAARFHSGADFLSGCSCCGPSTLAGSATAQNVGNPELLFASARLSQELVELGSMVSPPGPCHLDGLANFDVSCRLARDFQADTRPNSRNQLTRPIRSPIHLAGGWRGRVDREP